MDDREIIVKQINGVFYVYLNGTFYCSCESWAEVVEEIGGNNRMKLSETDKLFLESLLAVSLMAVIALLLFIILP